MALSRNTRPQLAARKAAESAVAEIISAAMGERVGVVLTRNRMRLVSVRMDRRRRRTLRMNAALAECTPGELGVVVAWMKDVPGSHQALRTLLDRHAARIDEITARTRPPSADRGRGKHHDLLEILSEVKAHYFPDLPPVYIAWSGRETAARRRRLGSWTVRGRLIRIHRRLDAPDIPRFFVASVIHHELCHAALDPPRSPTGRRRVHGPEFRVLEEQFPELDRSREWERRNLRALLSP